MQADGIGGAPGPGAEIAGYRVKSVLGEGGMGTVYLAERPIGGVCALKVLSRRLAHDPSYATRFKREAQYAEALDHPHILDVYDAGEAPDGTLYLAMQYVRGADLAVLLARDGPLGLAQALSILGQVGDALDCAHPQGLVHRDVKPGNIIVAADGGAAPYAYLTDFGLSKNPDADSIALTKQGQFVGTTAYTAPEEILAKPRDRRVDVYSLGCVLYEALVGEPPFVRERALDVLYAHIGDPRPPVSGHRPDLPPEIDAVIAKAMAISPAERYSSCAEFIAAASGLLPDGALSTPDAVPSTPDVAPATTDVAPATPDAAPATADAAPATAEAAPSTVDAAPWTDRTMPAPALSAATSVYGSPGADATAASVEPLRLVVRAGAAQGQELVIADEAALGRLITLDGALADDGEISRRHAHIWRQADGAFVVEDRSSSNGTFVNGTRIDGPRPLSPGDELRIGATVFEVAASVAPEPVSSAQPQVPEESEASSAGAPEAAIADLVVEPPPSEPLKRVAIRLELDLEAGQLSVAIEHGATVRIVRDGNGWRVEIP